MLNSKITTVLFDLDGTLLPMEMEEFTKAYFSLLAKRAAPYGYEAESLVAAVWKGTKAMVLNDGTVKNCDRFWKAFSEILGEDVLKLRPEFDDFYAKEFHGAKAATRENPLAEQTVKKMKSMGYTVILATNPIFPAVGVRTRLSWLGLAPEDFSTVTAYEDSSFCKPNPEYFGEILKRAGKHPEECLMVGNDAEEDLAAAKKGIEVYLITDCLVNPNQRDLSGVNSGSFSDFMAYAGVS